MDLVDPKNESAHSRITTCIPSPSLPSPPPPQRQTKSGGLRGERRPSSLHKRCYCYHFFFCRRGTLGAGGCPKPRYLGNSSKTEIRPKNFPESTCCRNEEFRETRRCDEHPAHIIKTLLKPPKPPFSSGINNRTSSAKLRCQVFADLELTNHVTLFE